MFSQSNQQSHHDLDVKDRMIFNTNNFELWANVSSNCSSSPIRKWGQSGRGEPLSPTHPTTTTTAAQYNLHNYAPPQCKVYTTLWHLHITKSIMHITHVFISDPTPAVLLHNTLCNAQLHTSVVHIVSSTLCTEHITKYIIETAHYRLQSTAHSAHTLHPCIKSIVMSNAKTKRV